MTTKIMQRLAGKVSVVIMVALLIAAVGTYGLSNSKHDSTGRATAAVSPSKVEAAPAANAGTPAVSVVKDVNVSVRTTTTTIPSVPVQSASAPAAPPPAVMAPPTVTMAPTEVAQAQVTPLADARAKYAKLPLSFIPNQGQFEKGVEFEGRGSGYLTSLTDDAIYVGLHSTPTKAEAVKQSLVRLGFAGANKLNFQPSEKQTSYANYIGGPASHWKQHVPNYGRVTAANVYPGIDTTFYGNQSSLQFDFVVKPGADPKAIQLKIDGGQVKLDENGDLAVATELGTVYQRKPVLYQEANGVRQPVDGSYKLDGNTVTFEVGAYDSSRTLTIDPLINFSLVVGGLATTQLNAVAEDAGAVYVAGTTTSNTLNLTGPSTISGARAASAQSDAIVVSFTRDGTTVNWYSFIGGSDQDSGLGIAVEDPTTNAPGAVPPPGFPNNQFGIYVVGQTFSTDLALNAAAANTYQGGGDGWIIRLTGGGAQSAGPRYIGSPNLDSATSVAVRCPASCATHVGQDDVFIGMFVGGTITSAPALTPQGAATVTGAQAGAVIDLRATTLGGGGVHGDVLYLNATQSASVTALSLLPYPLNGNTLQAATRIAFAGTVSAPGGLNGNVFINAVQGGHGGTDGFGFGGGLADGMWGIANTQNLGALTPLSAVSSLDYIGGAGNDNVKGVAPLLDGNIVVVGDTDALPFSTTGVGGVISGNLPPQNTSFGANGLAASGGSRNVVAAIINPGGIGATATATAGAAATGAATLGTAATPTITYGTPATVANAAAGVTATATVTPGAPNPVVPITIVQGTAFQVNITQGVQATAIANMSGTGVASISIINPGSGYWMVPTISFSGGACAITPVAVAQLTGPSQTTPNGSVVGIAVTNGGVCAGTPAVVLQAPGIQGVSVTNGGNGYQGMTNVSIPFDGSCPGPGTAPSASITASGTVHQTNQSFPTGALALGTPGPSTPGTFSAGIGCTTPPTTAGTNVNVLNSTTASPGIQSLSIPAVTGYDGGFTVSAVFSAPPPFTCGRTPAASVVVPGVGANQTLPAGNILTDSGQGCTTGNLPVAANVTITPPGLRTVNLTLNGTGYTTQHIPVVTFTGGTCTVAPAVPQSANNVIINNVSGNITNIVLGTSGSCTTPPTGVTIDAGGVTNDQVLTPGSGYNPASPPPVTIAAPPANPGHCAATAQANATVGAGGAITGIVITDPGCGYPNGSNPAVTIGGPGVSINAGAAPGNGGTGYSASAPPTVTLPAGFCSTGLNPLNIPPTFNASSVTVTGGVITAITPSNMPSCSGATGTFPLTLTGAPGITGITQTTTGNSYNVAPTLTFTGCTTQPMVTATLLGAAPTGVNPTGYTILNSGAGCTTTGITYSAPGLLSPPTAGQVLTPPVAGSPFTVTNPGLGYAATPTVTVSGCTTAPAATACVAGLPSCSALVPPAVNNTVASIALNTSTSGGNGCAAPVVTISGGTTPGFAALDYIGGAGGGALPTTGVTGPAEVPCGSGCSYGNSVTTDANSNIYIAGQTTSPAFPVVTNPAWSGSTALKGNSDGFVSRITEVGGTIQGTNGGGFSTYFGGSSDDAFNGIAIDQLLDLFVAGVTFSSDFPVTQGAAFSGTNDGTLTNLLFNNMVVAPTTTATFVTPFGVSIPASCPATCYTVNFANAGQPFSVAGGPVGGAPGTNITYSSNSSSPNSVNWLSIGTSPGGFSLAINPGTGSTGLAPDNYTATFLISSPNSDTPPITFTVKLTVTATFTVYNCGSAGTPCTIGTAPVSNFNFAYTKAEDTTQAGVAAALTQPMTVGLVGIPANAGTNAYPAPGTFSLAVNYNTNPNLQVANGSSTCTPGTANCPSFQWFTVGTINGGICPAGCSGEPFGTPLSITIVPSVLDMLSESGAFGTNMAAGTITFTQTNPGGGGITSIVITVTATVTPRLVFTSSSNVGFAISCYNGAPPALCITPSATSPVKVRGKDDVINVVSQGHPNKLVVITLDPSFTANTPPGGTLACFTTAAGGVQVPAGAYQAPSTSDPTATDLSLPIEVNMTPGNAACVQGIYHVLLTISGTAANEGAGDSIKTTAGFNALGPDDSPIALPPVTVPATITLGNELQSALTAFAWGTNNIDSQEGLPAGNPLPTISCTAPTCTSSTAGTVVTTVSLTCPGGSCSGGSGAFSTPFAVQCTNPGSGPYTPTNGGAGGPGQSASCDWFTATLSSTTLSSTGSPTATLTVALTPLGAGGINAQNMPTNGGPAGNQYLGTVQLIYNGPGGNPAGNSLIYPVSLTEVRQPLNWVQPGGGTPNGVAPGNTGSLPPSTTFTTTVGAGIPANQSCGSLYSNENYINAVNGEYVAFSPRNVGLRVAALANQTFAAASSGAVGGGGATASAGWLSVSQSGATTDTLTCSVNILNLATGTYTACIDAVDLGPGGSASGPSPNFSAAATSCPTAWPGTGRLIGVVTLTVNAAPILSASPSSATFNYQQNTGTTPTPANVVVTLTDANAVANIQNVFASASTSSNSFGNWLMVNGPATSTGGVNVAAGGNTAITISVVPGALSGAGALAQGTYQGVINLSCANCTLQPATIPVQLTITGGVVISSVPGTLSTFNYQINGPTPAPQNLAVNLSSLPVPNAGYTVAAASTGNWLQIVGLGTPPTPLTSGTVPSTTLGFQVSVNTAALIALGASNIPYPGTVTITVPGATNSPVVLNVGAIVSPQPNLNVTTPAGFAYTVGGTQPNSQTLTFSAGVNGVNPGAVLSVGFTATLGSCTGPASGPADPFTLMLSGGTPGTSVSSIAGNIGVTQTQVALAANVGAITSAMAGTYSCTLNIVSPGTSGGPTAANTPLMFPVTLTVSTQPIITVGACSANTFNYTLTTAAPSPASITCPVTNSDPSIPITSLAVASGCPASWLTCALSATTVGSTAVTLTLTPSNLANQNPGTFGPTNIVLSGVIPGGTAIANAPGVGVTQINTPLITLTPSTGLTFGPFTQGNLTPPGNQTVAGTLAEGPSPAGTPAGPGTAGTGGLTSIVDASSFAAGSCTGGVTAGPTNWLSVTQTPTGAGTSNTAYSIIIAVNPAVFPTLTSAATCTGKIDVTSAGVTPAAAAATIPVSFTINPQSGITVSTAAGMITPGSTISPFTIVNGYPVSATSTAAALPLIVSTSPTQGQQYTVTIQPVTGGNWLTTSGCTASNPCTANAATSSVSLGVAAAANTLAPGMYSATVAVAPAAGSSSPTNTVTFVVTLTVDQTAALTESTTGSLGGPFYLVTAPPYFTTPGTLTLAVATASASAGAPATPTTFTVTQTALTGSTPSNLLVINGTQPYTTTGTSTTVSVTVTYSAAVANTLAAGTYGGTMTVTVTGTGVTTNPQTIAIPWSLTIDAEALIQTTPTAASGLIINCVTGLTCTATLGVSATSTGANVNIPVTSSVTSLPTPWLSITPPAPTAANTTPISLSANTVGLQVNTSYAGQVVITSNAAGNSPYTVPVTLNVIAATNCAFTASAINLPSTGTTTGGVLPEVPGTVTLSNTTGCTGNFTVTSNAPWLVATGGTGVTYTAESNAHSTAQSGILTITNSSSVPSTYSVQVTVTEAGSTAPEIPNRQVTALYQSILGRDPDSGGYIYWTTSGLPLGTMAFDFFTSPESFNSNFAVIAAYQAATGAPPSYAQFTAAVAAVRAGTQTISGLFTSLTAGNSGYSATNLYQNLLNRATTSGDAACIASGLATCFQTIIGYQATVSPVSATNNEFQSTGTFSHGADHTNGLFITMLYYTILGRNPDQGGYNFWLNIANAGGPGIIFQGLAGYPTALAILGPGTQGTGFIGSPEFTNLYQ